MNTFQSTIFSLLLLTSFGSNASPPTRIQFAKGATGGGWSGEIKNGTKTFILRLAKGQSLVVGGDVYTWSVIAPDGSKYGCGDNDYCYPDSDLLLLPYSGDYLVSTHYRMSDCATCPTTTTRHATIYFDLR